MAIHLLGIRHHGPGSCRNVLEYLQKLQPDLILLEGPAEAETLLPCVLNEQMEPPVALLACGVLSICRILSGMADDSLRLAERSTVTLLRFTTGTFDGAKSGTQ